jgi:hypothetical protein
MAEAELERRWKVWLALSDAFLDTETRWFFPRIAAVLVDSGYGVHELDRIWRFEIVPECFVNLMLVAGEWTALALDGPALIRRASRRPGLLRWLVARAAAASVESQWRSLLLLRGRLMVLESHQREAVVGAWSLFAAAYLETRLEDLVTLDEKVRALRDGGLTRAECEVSFADDFRPIYAELLRGRERATEGERTQNVRDLIERAFR